MASTSPPGSRVIPAQLSFLAIYNPSLGERDDEFRNQIVFYYSKAAKARSKNDGKDPAVERELRDQENEKLRHVGLAQGMVNFARSFSNGEAVDSVDTQKSRIILHELESGWWILASVDLTQLPATPTTPSTSPGKEADSAPNVEYSSREVSPPALLIEQLIRAHSVFLLHHGYPLSELYSRLQRTKFCNILDKFWARFAGTWDVMLHSSPAVDIFGGLKLAAGGELGIGVGEEEWGSGEREVLEDFARRTDGLVDLLVSRFGEPSPAQQLDKKGATGGTMPADSATELEPWLGNGRYTGASDGVVFSGVGALSRASLRDISHWVESIYCYGEYAYGVKDNPASARRKRRRRNPKEDTEQFSPELRKGPGRTESKQSLPPGIPPPIVSTVESSLDKASAAVESADNEPPAEAESFTASLGDPDKWVKYLTLGYGTAWGGRGTPTSRQTSAQHEEPEVEDLKNQNEQPSMRYIEPAPDIDRREEKIKAQIAQENTGYFIIGLKGDMSDDADNEASDDEEWNSRIFLRTVNTELVKKESSEETDDRGGSPSSDGDQDDSSSDPKNTRLRVVVYVHRPFIYTFLFHSRTESLTISSFYSNLHTYFSPLHRPLSLSTSPTRVAARIANSSLPYTTTPQAAGTGPNTSPIYDLVYDPRTLTTHCSIPNIPEPGTLVAEGLGKGEGEAWTRVEAINVHGQILATVAGTRRRLWEIERTGKTNRGWWVVWMRLPPSAPETDTSASTTAKPSDGEGRGDGEQQTEFRTSELREAFLVRRARDPAATGKSGSAAGRITSGMWRLGGASTEQKMGGAAAGWGPKGLAEGIGIDARRYVEGLLSLNR